MKEIDFEELINHAEKADPTTEINSCCYSGSKSDRISLLDEIRSSFILKEDVENSELFEKAINFDDFSDYSHD